MKKMITRRNFLKAAGVSAAALGLAACGGSSSSTASSAASSTAASSTAAKADGKVYYLNFKPEQDQDWQDLAAEYTKETGVPVTVVTAASGQYETTLMSEMEKSEAPTLFQVNGPVGLANWKDYCYDLSGSQLYGELTSDSFALKDGDAVTSIAYVIETYGIIYNKELLTAAGYKQEDIKGFADLKKVADDIQARKAELGMDGAFTSAGMDGSSDWRFKTHLANLPIYYEYKADGISSTDAIKGTYLDNYKQIWDLYITDSTCDPKLLASKTGNDAVAEFVGKKAVFYQNGTWAYNDVKDLGDDNLGMLPIYIGVDGEENQGLCTGSENFWCVNNTASEADIQATLVAFIIGFIWPFIWGVYLSFQRFTTVSKTTFVGIQNYLSVFQDSTFLHAFGFTAVFTVVSTVLINVCAFAIALVLTRGIKGTNIFRTVFFMPNLIGGILLGYIWQILLNGVLANLQKPLLALDAKAGFVGLVILMCWQQIGYMMIIYVAGLQSVPGDLIEAAKIDGANDREILFKIKIPMVMPSVTICTFLTLTNSFKLFDQNVALTAGEPANASEMLALNIYNTFYGRSGAQWKGIGQAKAVVFFLIVVVISLIQLHFTRSKEVQQ